MLSRRVTGLLLLACLAFFCSPALAFDAFGAGVDPQPASPWAVALQKVGAVPDAIVHPGSPSAVPSSTTPVAALFGDSKSFAISTAAHLRNLLADFAVNLRDIRYHRGGHEPSTGFDCSGFVRYVFRNSLGLKLPSTSASQFHAGVKVSRADMKTGDLVFFRTRGKRISHVGIYLGNGHFIHAPTTGKRVSISSLDNGYWSKHFAGAKRPKVLS
jgi:cell wall-associated NlpC family hydrolase